MHPPVHDLAAKPSHSVIYQAGFPAQYLLVYQDLPCTEADFLRAAAELCKDCAKDHTLCATRPQVQVGLSSLVAVPPWVRHIDYTVYVLDFSFWRGPVYAVLDWKFVTFSDLAAAAKLHVNEPWQVFHPDFDDPLCPDHRIPAAPGDVFVFCPEGCRPTRGVMLGEMLVEVAAWDPCPPNVPREKIGHSWLALRSHVTRTPSYAGTCLQELQNIASEALHSAVEELDFEFPAEDSPLQALVHQGSAIRGVLAAEPKSTSGHRHGAFVFVDSRLIGIQPSHRFCSPGWIGLTQLLDFLRVVKIPSGYRVVPTGVQVQQDSVLVYDRCTIVLRFEECSGAISSGHFQDARIGSRGPDTGAHEDGEYPNHSNGPNRYGRDTPPPPDPEDLLGAAPRDEERIVPDEAVTVDFKVFAPRFQHESYQISVNVPCDLDHALRELSQQRSSGFSEHFDELIPAFPQPDVAFASVLAVPSWLDQHSCVLVDAREHDGRLFAIVINGRINRASLFLHLKIDDDPSLQLFCGRARIENNDWRSFLSGETIAVKCGGRLPTPPVSLADMLLDRHDWITPSPDFPGPHFPAFCVLSDGGHKVILVDVDAVRSFEDFKKVSADAFQHRSGHVNVCSSIPRSMISQLRDKIVRPCLLQLSMCVDSRFHHVDCNFFAQSPSWTDDYFSRILLGSLLRKGSLILMSSLNRSKMVRRKDIVLMSKEPTPSSKRAAHSCV